MTGHHRPEQAVAEHLAADEVHPRPVLERGLGPHDRRDPVAAAHRLGHDVPPDAPGRSEHQDLHFASRVSVVWSSFIDIPIGA